MLNHKKIRMELHDSAVTILSKQTALKHSIRGATVHPMVSDRNKCTVRENVLKTITKRGPERMKAAGTASLGTHL